MDDPGPTQGQAAPVRAPSDGDAAGAARHTPTLMAGEIPGHQGEIHAWSPSPWRCRARLAWSITLATSGFLLILLHAVWVWIYGPAVSLSLPGDPDPLLVAAGIGLAYTLLALNAALALRQLRSFRDHPLRCPARCSTSSSRADRAARVSCRAAWICLVLVLGFCMQSAGTFWRMANQFLSITCEPMPLSDTAGAESACFDLAHGLRGASSIPSRHSPGPAQHLWVTLFVAQDAADGAAEVSVPGYITRSQVFLWAPVDYAHGRRDVYAYRIYLSGIGPNPVAPHQLQVHLRYPSHERWVTAAVATPDAHRVLIGGAAYSNNWGDHRTPELYTGPVVGPLPPYRTWQFARLSIPAGAGSVREFRFYPPPVVEYSHLTGPSPAVAAAWLPGRVPASGVDCTVLFSDGHQQQIHLNRDVVTRDYRIAWGLPPDEDRPPGSASR